MLEVEVTEVVTVEVTVVPVHPMLLLLLLLLMLLKLLLLFAQNSSKIIMLLLQRIKKLPQMIKLLMMQPLPNILLLKLLMIPKRHKQKHALTTV